MSEAPKDAAQTRVNTGRMLILILVLSIGAVLAYRAWMSPATAGGKNYTHVPKEMQINYLPADYKINIDPDDAMVILSNPRRYQRDFDQLVKDLNVSIVDHVANRMGLTAELQEKARNEYLDNHHDYLKNLYFKDFVALKDTTSQIYQTWYNNESGNAIEALNEVASKYTCFLTNQIFTTILTTDGGSIYGKGESVDTPCGVALNEALRPLVARLEEKAAIEDFSRSKGLLQEKVETVIAELATMEVRDQKGINKNLQTKVWGMEVSSSDIEIRAISILKMGFRLDDYFNVNLNSRNGIVTITLPEPVILSHEVYPKIDKLDIGWMREVEGIDLNKGINQLREVFRQEALESDLGDRSKTQAIELMNTFFGPLVTAINKDYKLQIKFEDVASDQVERPIELGTEEEG